ncbi:MAG TPA: citrate transporter [Woeseiaceae bacterium]|nr:citrate transporter [Woeseiaceae bacterium]
MKANWLAAAGIGAMLAVIAAGAFFNGAAGPEVLGVRAEFLLFVITLLGVALFHHRTLEVALTGLVAILALKLLTAADFQPGHHLLLEAPILVNLFGLLLGFAVLARHFEQSQVPEILPRFLPDDWQGGFVLLIMIFVLSSFLDNIAAAMIGGTVAMHVFKKRVDVGYLAAIVAASNAGGSGSVVGDTTTTMMWIEGVAAFDVLHAYIAAVPALLFFGVVAARQQQRHQPIQRGETGPHPVHWRRVGAVGLILVGAIAANILLDFPAAGVWLGILVSAAFVRTDWRVVPASLKGSLFLIALVTCASLMPVETLPPASWTTAFGLGWVSAVFDNIPLTKLALDQGNYDWGVLAYAVGFGGSMIWFGSSAGVALSTLFPAAKSVVDWLKRGWHVAVGYVIGFFVLLAVSGWHPQPLP